MTLFVVSFQPLDIVLNNYRVKTTAATGGRRILQHLDVDDPLSMDLGCTLILTLVHWLLAFVLIWGSIDNRILLSKIFSLLMRKLRSMANLSFGNIDAFADEEVDVVEKLGLWRQDPHTFDSQLKSLLRDYQCDCPSSIIVFSFKLLVVLCCIVIKLIPFDWAKPRRNKERHVITLSLFLSVVEQPLIGRDLSRLQRLWNQAVLMLTFRYCDERMTLAKLLILQSIPIDFVMKYSVIKGFGAAHTQLNSLPNGYRDLLTSPETRKLFLKSSNVDIFNQNITNRGYCIVFWFLRASWYFSNKQLLFLYNEK